MNRLVNTDKILSVTITIANEASVVIAGLYPGAVQMVLLMALICKLCNYSLLQYLSRVNGLTTARWNMLDTATTPSGSHYENISQK